MLRSGAEIPTCGELLHQMTANEIYNVLFLCTGNLPLASIDRMRLKDQPFLNTETSATSANNDPPKAIHI
jgi:hypothetical protein